jgi:hypothetical protein
MAKVGRKPEGDAPLCACGCGEPVRWLRGRGWSMYRWGHHIRKKNPNTGEHVRGDRNHMKNPEIAKKLSGENHWRNRPENKEKARLLREKQKGLTGSANPNWKGGRTSREGYSLIRRGDKYVPEHRVVMEEFLGRPLLRSEVIHHINGDKSDNRIENLKLYSSQSEHLLEHKCLWKNLSVKAPECACGCGKPVTRNTRSRTWNTYLPGHNPKPVKRPSGRAPLCVCGCGERVEPSKRYKGHWNRYVSGHHLVSGRKLSPEGPPPLCACGCGEKVNQYTGLDWNRYSRGHFLKKSLELKNAPFCACGCGERVLPSVSHRGAWNTFKRGHATRGISVDQPAPLCACGCGEVVETKRGDRWSKYRPGHSIRSRVKSNVN